MRILFLDDSDLRHRRFARNHIGQIVDRARSADEAIALLAANRYDVAYLDRDLDEQATLGLEPREKTGEDVAKFIAGLAPEKRPGKVIVHSLNQGSGPLRMVQILLSAGVPARREPFSEAS